MRPNSYASLLRRAQERLASIEHTSIASPLGTIEYAERGEGYPILVLHGIFGGFDAAYLTADPWIGGRFRIVAPSRFGCLGSSLPPDATTADQADAYAVLLDALGSSGPRSSGSPPGPSRRCSSRSDTLIGSRRSSSCPATTHRSTTRSQSSPFAFCTPTASSGP